MTVSPIASTTSALTSIQTNQTLENLNFQSLSTGRSVNSPANAQAFILAQGLLNRSGALSDVGTSIGQGVGAIQAATTGLNAISNVVTQLKALAQQALASTTPTQQTNLQNQYNALVGQVDSLAADSSYNGVSLIAANPGSVTISGAGINTTVTGTAADSASLGIGPAAGWSGSTANIQTSIASLNQASTTLDNQTANLGDSAAQLKITAAFVQNQSVIASQSAGNLTGTDLATAAANALSANTYRELGLAALRNSTQGQDAILGLFTQR